MRGRLFGRFRGTLTRGPGASYSELFSSLHLAALCYPLAWDMKSRTKRVWNWRDVLLRDCQSIRNGSKWHVQTLIAGRSKTAMPRGFYGVLCGVARIVVASLDRYHFHFESGHQRRSTLASEFAFRGHPARATSMGNQVATSLPFHP